MFILISGYCAIRAVILLLGLGFMLVCGVAEAQAIETEDDFRAPKVDLLTTRVVNLRPDLSPNYRFSANVVLARPADTMSAESLGSSPRPPAATKSQQQDFARPADAPWRQVYDGNRGMLQHLLRLEFRKDPVKITFRPHSVSIKGEQLDLQLKSDLVSMLWSKAF